MELVRLMRMRDQSMMANLVSSSLRKDCAGRVKEVEADSSASNWIIPAY